MALFGSDKPLEAIKAVEVKNGQGEGDDPKPPNEMNPSCIVFNIYCGCSGDKKKDK